MEKGGYLSRIDDESKRQIAIKLLLNGQETKEIDRIIYQDNSDKNLANTEIKKGRPRSSINLGQTTKIEILRKIMTSISTKESSLLDNHKVDWNDIKSVAQHWKIFLKALEMELQDEKE